MTPTSNSDARKRLAESIIRLDQRDRFHREWLRAMDETYPPAEPRDQERDMTSPTYHNEIVALLIEIRERLPKPREVDPDLAARNLDAFKHEAETPMRGHGDCCDDPDESWVTRDIEEAEGYYRVERARAEKAEAERDALRRRLDALRADVQADHWAPFGILARDDERAKGEQR